MALNMVNMMTAAPASTSNTPSTSNTSGTSNTSDTSGSSTGNSFNSMLNTSIESRSTAKTAQAARTGQQDGTPNANGKSAALNPLAQAVKQQTSDDAANAKAKGDDQGLIQLAQGDGRNTTLLAQLMQQSAHAHGDGLSVQGDNGKGSDKERSALLAMLGDKSSLGDKTLAARRPSAQGDSDDKDHAQDATASDSEDAAALLGALVTPQATHTTVATGTQGADARGHGKAQAARADALDKQLSNNARVDQAVADRHGDDVDAQAAFAKAKADATLNAQGDSRTLMTAASSSANGDASTLTTNGTVNANTLSATTLSANTMPNATLASSMPANPTPAYTATLNAPLGSAPWNQSLGQQVMHLSHAGNGQAELHLNPPDLGQLQVTLKMGENQAQVHFASPHAQVRAAVEAALPQLREALADSGISLGQTSVSDQGNGQAFAFDQQQSRSHSAGNGPAIEGLGDDPIAAVTTVPITGPSLNGGIDIFA